MYIVPVFVPHAGCIHECTFCNQRLISGQQQFSIREIEKQLISFIERLPADKQKQVALYGGSFTAMDMGVQREILQYVNSLADKYNITSLRVSTRPDCIHTNNLELLAEYNVQVVELGVQSLDDEVLALAKRGHDSRAVAPAVRLLQARGFEVGIQLMVGMQGQSFAVVKQTTAQVVQMQPDIVRIYPMMVLKDTELEQLYLSGAFAPLSLEESVEQVAYIWQAMREHNIKVIRMGLQSEELLMESIVAGAYHPAFGELVIQRYYLGVLVDNVAKLQLAGVSGVCISYPQRMASKIIGMKKYNKQYLQEQFATINFDWQLDELVHDVHIAGK